MKDSSRPVFTNYWPDSEEYNKAINDRCLELAAMTFQNGCDHQDRSQANAIKKAKAFRKFIETYKGE